MSEKEKPFHNPFAALRGLAGTAPATGDAEVTPEPAADDPSQPERSAQGSAGSSKSIPRALVRLERSGRGGKEVTVVEHMEITASVRDEWLKALKAALGCGGTLEDERLVLQGDQRKRLSALLQARGVKKVTLG